MSYYQPAAQPPRQNKILKVILILVGGILGLLVLGACLIWFNQNEPFENLALEQWKQAGLEQVLGTEIVFSDPLHNTIKVKLDNHYFEYQCSKRPLFAIDASPVQCSFFAEQEEYSSLIWYLFALEQDELLAMIAKYPHVVADLPYGVIYKSSDLTEIREFTQDFINFVQERPTLTKIVNFCNKAKSADGDYCDYAFRVAVKTPNYLVLQDEPHFNGTINIYALYNKLNR